MQPIDSEQTRDFGRGVDFGDTARDYGTHRQGFPEGFFTELGARGIAAPGITPRQRVLDLGTGTGTVARGLALRGAEVTGLDPADALIEQARALDARAGVSIDYVAQRAEATGFAEASFDVVTAGQCWHWFARDAAAREAHRVLRPHGRIAIAHFDWIPLPGNVVQLTEELIERYNPAWSMGGGCGLYPAWLGDLAVAGFTALETFSFDTDAIYSHEAWRGRIRASAGVGGSLDEATTARFDADLATALAEHFPGDPIPIPHRVWAVLGTRG